MTEPIPERVRWFKARVDGTDYGDSDELEEPTEANPANLCSSLCADGLHRPALDVDIACELIPSSTPSLEREQTVLRLPGAIKPVPHPEDDPAYVQMTVGELQEEFGVVSHDQVRNWVRENEGTYNAKNGHYLCDQCYINAGRPPLPMPGRWVAP